MHIKYVKKSKILFRLANSFNLTHIKRIPGYPKDYGDHVDVSFYVTNPIKSTAIPKGVLASMLYEKESDVEYALGQQVDLQTSAGPDTPPKASELQIANSVVIRIPSFRRDQVMQQCRTNYRIPVNFVRAPICRAVGFDRQTATIISIARNYEDRSLKAFIHCTISNEV